MWIVGAGLSSEYITFRALKAIMRADRIYIDTYTSIAPGIDEALIERLNPEAEVLRATRSMLEEESWRLVRAAAEMNIVVLVPGDPHYATTHIALLVEAREKGVEAHLIPGVAGPQAAIDAAGLQVYRFGKIVTLVYPEEGFKPYSTYDVIIDNRRRGLHSLVLLDLRLDEGKAMTIPEAVTLLLDMEKEHGGSELENALFIGVARAGLTDQKCVAGPPGHVSAADYPPPPHSLIITAPNLHPMEEEAISVLCEHYL